MKKIIANGFVGLMTLCGLLQFLLLPGLVWNIAFPFIQILILIFAFKNYRNSRFLKVISIFLIFLFLAEICFSIYSKLNTRSSGVTTEIKVMTYNFFFENRIHNQSIMNINKANPDILFVQELTPKSALALERKLENGFQYKMVNPLKGTHGIGIFSKHKLGSQKLVNNSAHKPYAQIVETKIEGKKIQLINTHLASPAIAVENRDNFFSLFTQNYQLRKKQIAELNKLAESNDHKYDCQLLVGDLNTLHSEPIFKRLKFKWTNSNNGLLRWMKFNFPNTSKLFPFVTLDYIMGRGQVKFKKSEVIDGAGSDHHAIMATIKL